MTNAVGCLACGRNFHEECNPPVGQEQECCCPTATLDSAPVGSSKGSGESKERLGVRKPDDEIGISAGRKRAAIEYVINREAPCEWQGKAECGGGLHPIVGCITGLQSNRHHGPVKNTSRNERNNIHLICAQCHNIWHAKNDPVYDEAVYNNLPHSPVRATAEDWLKWGRT